MRFSRVCYPRKKTPVDPQRYSERVQQLTSAYPTEWVGVCPSQLSFLDEAGACLTLTLDDGRRPRGPRVSGEKPTAKGQRIRTVAALSGRGLETAFC